MRTIHSLTLLSALLMTACVADVGAGKVKAEVAETPEAPAEAKPTEKASGSELAVDKSQSKISALGAKITATHPIVWKDWEGSVTVDGDSVKAVAFTVDMTTLEADHPKLTAHLLKPDFFDVENHPKAMFKSASIEAGSTAEGDWTHTVAGDFTIRGNTKRITFPAKVTSDAKAVTASTEFTIDRQDFGITYPGMADDAIQDNVVMTVSFVAPKG